MEGLNGGQRMGGERSANLTTFDFVSSFPYKPLKLFCVVML